MRVATADCGAPSQALQRQAVPLDSGKRHKALTFCLRSTTRAALALPRCMQKSDASSRHRTVSMVPPAGHAQFCDDPIITSPPMILWRSGIRMMPSCQLEAPCALRNQSSGTVLPGTRGWCQPGAHNDAYCIYIYRRVPPVSWRSRLKVCRSRKVRAAGALRFDCHCSAGGSV